ncbi:MAG: hypothetical protein ACHQT6_09880 [Candidatus Acidiferrales bacterium]
MRMPRMLLLPLCLSVMFCGGCLVKKRPAAHFATIVLAHPVIPSPTAEGALSEAPDLELEPAPIPARLGPPRNPPARPKVAAIPATEPVTAGKPSEPTIVPELSRGELEAAKADAQASLDVAERNLAATRGKALNAAQADLASKIRGFMDAAREAIKNSDWQRATNLAKKAEVLARELAEGL